jgi:hypothetical protein
VHIPLDARQHGAVVLQENAVLLSTAAPEISGLVVGGDNNTHGALQAASICGWAAGHPYCGGRRRMSWNAMGDGGIVVQVRVADGLMQVCDKAKVALPERGSTKASRQREETACRGYGGEVLEVLRPLQMTMNRGRVEFAARCWVEVQRGARFHRLTSR